MFREGTFVLPAEALSVVVLGGADVVETAIVDADEAGTVVAAVKTASDAVAVLDEK